MRDIVRLLYPQAPGTTVVLRTADYHPPVQLRARDPVEYLAADQIIDGTDPDVAALARELRHEHADDIAFSAAAFEYVRDAIAHSWDVQDRRVTVSASDTLRAGVGLCYCKAHLLTAMLRVEGVPAGLCYQRLTDDGRRFEVHGLLAVFLEGAWRRLDPRGNKPGIDAQFSLETERLAWHTRPDLGEIDYPVVFIQPHHAVITALTQATDMLALCVDGLPSAL
jgi:transglutaminase-like putative cysteine protease